MFLYLRIKTPLRKPGTFLCAHPLEEKYIPSANAEKKRKNEALWLEHKVFMKKLHVSRYLRSSVETLAASYIQRTFRGYYIRVRRESIKNSCILRKKMRLQIRQYIISNSKSRGEQIVLTLGDHRRRYKEWRYLSASTIQRGFRCFIGRVCLRRTRYEVSLRRRFKSIMRIQRFVRMVYAIKRVSFLKFVKLKFNMARGARLLQTAFRSLLARRKVSRRRYALHWYAARIIQCCYRYYCGNALVMIMKQRFSAVKSSSDVITLQCFVRQRLAVRKIEHLISARFQNLIFKYSSMIQAVVRGHLARAFVNKILFFITAETKRKRKQNNLMLVNSLAGLSIKSLSAGNSSSTLLPLSYQGSLEDLNISKHQGKVKGSISIVNSMINPLQMAVKNRNIEVVKGSLDITVMTSEIVTDLLITAIQANEKSSSDPSMLEYLLNSGFSKYINDMHTKSGMTVLQNACLEGNISCVEVLLANNADKSIRDKMGHTALHKACKSSRLGDSGSRLPLVFLLLGIEATIDGGWCIRPERLLEIENTKNALDVHLSFASDGTILDVPLKDTRKESSKDPTLFPLNVLLRTDPKPPPQGGEPLTDLNPDTLNPLTTSLDLLTDPLEIPNSLIDILEKPYPTISSKREEKIEIKEIGEVYKDIKKVDNENPSEIKQKKIDEFIVKIAFELNLKGMIKYEHGCLSIYAYLYMC